jgi:hypothetical protein
MKTKAARMPEKKMPAKDGPAVSSTYDVLENVLTLRHEWPKVEGREQWYLLQADEHFDNAKCDRERYRRDLDEAVSRNAGIIKFGDFFCAMQGKYDKRSSMSELRDAHKVAAYSNALVNEAAEFHAPYAKHLLMVGVGNHESGFTNKTGTDLTALFVEKMQDRYGSRVIKGGYAGWLRFMVQAHGGVRRSLRAWYTHGYGGGGPVTLDTIQAQRQMAYIHGADMMFSGHTHDAWLVERVAISLTDCGKQQRIATVQCKIPTYKDEFRKAAGGWHIETGKPPKPMGGYWLRLWWCDSMLRFSLTRTDG